MSVMRTLRFRPMLKVVAVGADDLSAVLGEALAFAKHRAAAAVFRGGLSGPSIVR